MAQVPDRSPPTPLNRRFHGCSSIREYEVMGKLGEGTFGEVHKARSKRTGAVVALKKILMHNEKDGFPITALREIKLLKMLSHVNVLKLEEMAVERNKGEGRKRAILYMVTPYMDHDLSGLLDNTDVQFTEPQIKCYMLQLLEGLRYLHDSHILHRDMKAANLLINNRGVLQIADFGLARHYDEPVPRPGRGAGEARRDYTTLVVTRWYRPPELLLQLRRYTTAIDMWGAGCVFGEMFKRKPILTGSSDLNQAQIIFDLVGSPNDQTMPGWSSLPGCDGVKDFGGRSGNLAQVFREQGASAISLLSELLKLDWRKRVTAVDALQHPYFKMEPKPARPEDLPWFQDSHELDRRSARGQKAALPPAPAGGTVGMGPHADWSGPNSQGPANGAPFANGDRQHRGGGGWHPPPLDRGPPGVGPPHRGPDSRVPQGSHEYRGPPRRQPWQQENGPPPRHPLPPNPHATDSGRHPPPHASNPPAYRPTNSSKVDTYIPNYDSGQRRDDRRSHERDDRRSIERDPRGRRGSRDEPSYRDRGADRREYGNRDRRDTRSRSPTWKENRDSRPRDRNYDRDRERDMYRR